MDKIKKGLEIFENYRLEKELLEVLKNLTPRGREKILRKIMESFSDSDSDSGSWLGEVVVKFIIEEKIIVSPSITYKLLKEVLLKIGDQKPWQVEKGIEFSLKMGLKKLANELFRFLSDKEKYEYLYKILGKILGKYPKNRSFKEILKGKRWKLIERYGKYLSGSFLERIFYEEKNAEVLKRIAIAMEKKKLKVEKLFERFKNYASFEDILEIVIKKSPRGWLEGAKEALVKFEGWKTKIRELLENIEEREEVFLEIWAAFQGSPHWRELEIEILLRNKKLAEELEIKELENEEKERLIKEAIDYLNIF